VLGVARLRHRETGEGARRHMDRGSSLDQGLIRVVQDRSLMVQSISLCCFGAVGSGVENWGGAAVSLGGCGGCGWWRVRTGRGHPVAYFNGIRMRHDSGLSKVIQLTPEFR